MKRNRYKVALQVGDIVTVTYTVSTYCVRVAILIAKAKAYFRFGKLKYVKVYAEEVKENKNERY